MKFLLPTISAISAAVLSSSVVPLAAVSQPADCLNYWKNPQTGQVECLGAAGTAVPSNSQPAAPKAPSTTAPRTAQSGTGNVSTEQMPEFTKRFVSACNNYPVQGHISSQQLAKFCTCAAGEAVKLPPEKLQSLANASQKGTISPDLLQDPALQNIATTCISTML